MADRKQLEFFLLRYVPDAVKNEFVNIGVMMFEPGANGAGFADVRFTRDWRRAKCLDSLVDIEVLEGLEFDLRAQLREGGSRESMLRRLEDSFSNTIQISATNACLADDPAKEIEALVALYCDGPRRAAGRATSGRQRILRTMRDAFEQAGVWGLLRKEIAAVQYTHSGDPLKIDCGYRPNGVIKMFQALPLAGGVDAAKGLAFSYPGIVAGIARVERASASLTAVVESDLDRGDEAVGFALAILEGGGIGVTSVTEVPRLADVARQELGV